MKEFVFRRGGEGRSAQKRAECRSWREQFHAAELIRGGERSWISAAVSRSMTFIGPRMVKKLKRIEKAWFPVS